jgi:hypothetical protein
MAKAERSVFDLVNQIKRKEIVLPEMQRRYVWKSSQVKDLVDSIYRGYPSGAILLWETPGEVRLQEFAVEQDGSPLGTQQLLLDGQQRLTSLTALLTGEDLVVRGRRKPIKILFNLDHPEIIDSETPQDGQDDDEVSEDEEDLEDSASGDDDEFDSDDNADDLSNQTFIVAQKKYLRLPNWVSVTDVLKKDNTEILSQAGVTSFSDPRFKKYNQRINKIKEIPKYVYRLDVLERSLTYKEVTDIFVRVNSKGTTLRGSDLALAQVTAKWPGCLADFQAFEAHCSGQKFKFDVGVNLRALVSIVSDQCKFNNIGSISRHRLEQDWPVTKKAMNYSLNFLKVNCGVKSSAALSSSNIAILIAYIARNWKFSINPAEAEALRRYILLSNAKGRYTRSSSETVLDQDLRIVNDGGRIPELLAVLKAQVGRLTVESGDFVGRKSNSPLFRTAFLAFEAMGAKDWKNSLAISELLTGNSYSLQVHHIFPRSRLEGVYEDREINDVANFAFISADTNQWIKARPPVKYVPEFMEVRGREIFDNQCIPTDADFLEISNYRDFLAKRRELMATRLNEFLNTEE